MANFILTNSKNNGKWRIDPADRLVWACSESNLSGEDSATDVKRCAIVLHNPKTNEKLPLHKAIALGIIEEPNAIDMISNLQMNTFQSMVESVNNALNQNVNESVCNQNVIVS